MYRIAGIDVHKKKLAVAVTDVEVYGEYHDPDGLAYGEDAQFNKALELLG